MQLSRYCMSYLAMLASMLMLLGSSTHYTQRHVRHTVHLHVMLHVLICDVIDISFLLSVRADVNAFDNFQWTALHHAAHAGEVCAVIQFPYSLRHSFPFMK